MTGVLRNLTIKIGFEADDAPLDAVDSKIKDAEKSSKSLDKSFGGTAKNIAKSAALAATAVAAVVAAAVVGAKKLVDDFAVVGDEIGKTSDNLGLATDELQEFRFAAREAGLSNEELDGAIASLNEKVGEFATTGAGPLKDSLERLGFTGKDLTRVLNEAADATPAERFELFADVIGNVEDAAVRTRVANELLGGAGAKAGVLFAKGAKGIREARKEYRELGGVIEEDAIRQSEALLDAQEELGTVFSGLKNQIVGDLLPGFVQGTAGVRDFLAENRELISSGINDFLDKFNLRMQQAAQVGRDVLEFLRPFIDGAREAAADVLPALEESVGLLIDTFGALLDTITEVFDFGSEGTESFAKTVTSFLGEAAVSAIDVLTDGIEILRGGVEDLGEVFDLFSDGRVIDGIIKLGETLLSGLLEPLRLIAREVVDLADKIPGLSSRIPDVLREFGAGGRVSAARQERSAEASRQRDEEARSLASSRFAEEQDAARRKAARDLARRDRQSLARTQSRDARAGAQKRARSGGGSASSGTNALDAGLESLLSGDFNAAAVGGSFANASGPIVLQRNTIVNNNVNFEQNNRINAGSAGDVAPLAFERGATAFERQLEDLARSTQRDVTPG